MSRDQKISPLFRQIPSRSSMVSRLSVISVKELSPRNFHLGCLVSKLDCWDLHRSLAADQKAVRSISAAFNSAGWHRFMSSRILILMVQIVLPGDHRLVSESARSLASIASLSTTVTDSDGAVRVAWIAAVDSENLELFCHCHRWFRRRFQTRVWLSFNCQV